MPKGEYDEWEKHSTCSEHFSETDNDNLGIEDPPEKCLDINQTIADAQDMAKTMTPKSFKEDNLYKTSNQAKKKSIDKEEEEEEDEEDDIPSEFKEMESEIKK